jgi:hypothetical protein
MKEQMVIGRQRSATALKREVVRQVVGSPRPRLRLGSYGAHPALRRCSNGAHPAHVCAGTWAQHCAYHGRTFVTAP